MKVSEFRLEDSRAVCEIGVSKMQHRLQFSGDEIEFRNRTTTIKGFMVKEFIDQFDNIVFIDKEGKETVFKKVKKK